MATIDALKTTTYKAVERKGGMYRDKGKRTEPWMAKAKSNALSDPTWD